MADFLSRYSFDRSNRWSIHIIGIGNDERKNFLKGIQNLFSGLLLLNFAKKIVTIKILKSLLASFCLFQSSYRRFLFHTRDDGFLLRSQMLEIILGDRKFSFADKYGSGQFGINVRWSRYTDLGDDKNGRRIFLPGVFIRRIRIYTSYTAGHGSRCAWI